MKSVSSSKNNSLSRKEQEICLWKEFVREIKEKTSVREIGRLLDILITAHEQKQIIKRREAISLLKEGKSYREIGKLLWLSPATISSIRKSMLFGKNYLTRHARWKVEGRKKKQFSTFPRRPNTEIILPHGKLVYPQKRRR